MKAILRDTEKRHWKWIPFVGSAFILGTINIAGSIRFSQIAWIDQRDIQGGPLVVLFALQTTPANVIAIVTEIIMIALGDSFLIARCHALWQKKYITVCLSILLMATLSITALHFFEVVTLEELDGDALNLRFSIPFATLLTFLHVLLCLLLLWRIVDLRRRLPLSDLNPIAKKFKSIEGVIIESAIPIAFLSFVFLMLFVSNNPGTVLIFPLLVQAMGIIPSLIVLRMIGGYAWSPRVLRNVGASNALQGQLGHAPGTTELSARDFNNAQSTHSFDLKGNLTDV
ncbi:hypothetical protein M422DRAFT_168389 [Sphaerobolus stellatus SS14]|uniref:Uncharacterized protein n=1 Tax=Sphaerobolus stellatus (strain SS14) TaxID=990650 RepID=A0A0C9VBL4_SPHS4|nr:hypothetical protein M422DRAFT_168389 [Sphaerobolus stellatus SS14]